MQSTRIFVAGPAQRARVAWDQIRPKKKRSEDHVRGKKEQKIINIDRSLPSPHASKYPVM